MTTQPKVYPWRRVLRSTLQAAIGFAPLMPLIYQAATLHDPEAATGLAGLALSISAGVTRVMAIPQVESFLQRTKWLSWLAARPREPDSGLS